MTAPSNPYVGPRAFRSDEALHGRNRERRDLLNLLIAERIILLYSPSGAGKTSLIQAGLCPELLEDEFHVLPIARVGAMPDPDLKVNRYLFSVVASLASALPQDHLDPMLLGRLTLADYLAAIPRVEDQRTVLILDQFEEIFTCDASCEGERETFFRQLGEALKDPDLWALIAMREDYIANLDPFSGLLPTRLANRYRLDLLGRDAATEAIERPATAEGVIFEPKAADKLVDSLREIGGSAADTPRLGPYVEPVHLQIACLQLWERMQGSWGEGAERRIRIDDIHATQDVDEALGQYYDEELAAIAKDEADPDGAMLRQRKIREWFDQRLITPEGVRAQVLQGSEECNDIGQEFIDRLIDAYLVRTDSRRNATWYELAHDRLIKPVRTRNNEWFRTHFSPFRRQAELWRDRGRDPDLLFSGASLDEAQDWAERHAGRVGPLEKAFLEACYKARADRHGERRRRLALVAASAAAALSIISGLTYYSWSNAAHAAEQSRQREEIVKAHGDLDRVRGELRAARGGRMRFLREFGAERGRLDQVLTDLQGRQTSLQGEIVRLAAVAATASREAAAERRKTAEFVRQHPEYAGWFASERAGLAAANEFDPGRRAEAARAPGVARARADNAWHMNLWDVGATLRIRFLDGTPAARARVLAIALEWTQYANVRFVASETPDAEVRISFIGDGNFSFVGTDSLGAPLDRPTVIFGGLDREATPLASLRPAVLHEFGHVLGLIHEHQNPNVVLPWNREAIYRAFGPAGRSYVDDTILVSPPVRNYRPFDPTSIMLYSSYAPVMFTSNLVITRGPGLSETDKQFIRRLYPFPGDSTQ